MNKHDNEIRKDKLLAKEQARKEKLEAIQLDKQRARIHNEMIAYQKVHSREKKSAPKDVYISLKNINKIYPNHVQAVYDFNLDVKQHEFIVLVGPSGCGKSTTLRMIAGLEDITAGDLFIDGTYANDLHPKDREIAMVFQSYALYPHMSVAGNMSFSLRIRKFPTLKVDKYGEPILGINKTAINNLKRIVKNLEEYKKFMGSKLSNEKEKEINEDIRNYNSKIAYLMKTPVECYVKKHMPKDEIRKRVLNAAKILQIEEYLNRKPKALSGGQCQRVALGRAIVRNAKVFLMDEPLSNLDAKLRVTMRSEIIKLHKSLNATTIYVTHDQTEAMTMATRIVVMSKGYVQQIDTPINIYNHPKNIFVATFIGSPAMNMIKAVYKNKKLYFKDVNRKSKDFVIQLNDKQSSEIETFYKNSISNCINKIKEIDESFVERNDVLRRIVEANGDKEKIFKLKQELKLVENANKDRKAYVDYMEKYSKLDLKKGVEVIFGVRPEDIIKIVGKKKNNISEEVNFVVSVAELLGHEYYAHSYFQGNEIVAKIQTKELINTGDVMKVGFDMERIHIFDEISEVTII